ncbi:hypothetical protein CROQUDRAFT_665657 [Cronartium quercuum f. sp. fusiforme G11]|uniref:Uncharacterized protein n=1 Tax=Cronartium quercuum f. sp. fusiforme G11 TaxID=708437 RepID=A0A9P6N6L2_9BASI|nr:hypothetical protein CROQUDRAFT_665657 [Cronartium quercuum f. sp. fusiforme G11]
MLSCKTKTNSISRLVHFIILLSDDSTSYLKFYRALFSLLFLGHLGLSLFLFITLPTI